MRKFLLSLVALVGLCSAAAFGNYAMTQGAGTTFGSTVVGGIHYVQMFICDLTTPAQCATVSSGGAVKVDGSGATQPVSGTVTANLGTIAGAATAAKQPALGTAGSASTDVITVQGIASMTPLFMQSATAPVSTMNSASANSGVNVANAAVFDDTSPTAITENSFGFLRMSANRNLYGTIRDAAGNERGVNVDASNRLTTAPSLVSGSVASGAFASGSIASGAIASGAIAAGAQVDLLTMRGTVAGGTVAANSLLTGGQYNSTPITVTNTQQAALQLDANGYLKVNTAAGAAAGGTSSNFGSAFPTPGTAVGFSDGTNMVAAKVGAVANVAAATNMVNVLGIAQYNATPLTVTDTRYQSLQSDVNGFLKVNVTNANANGQATAANSSPVVLPTAQVTADPCALGNKTNLPISQNGTSSVQLVALSGSTVIYVCSLSLIAAGATTAVLTTGTGTACATGNAAVLGDTTANVANGLSFAANGGLTLGNGAGTVLKGAASSQLCMTLGTNVRMSGNLTYIQQ